MHRYIFFIADVKGPNEKYKTDAEQTRSPTENKGYDQVPW